MAGAAAELQPKILIADDNPHGVELLEAYLSDAPYSVRTAGNGEETLRLVKEWRPDVVLLDVMMPKFSGFEVCKVMRSQPELRDIGVLMVTALDQPSDVERAVDAGTDDFLTKPIHQSELLIRIRALLQAPRRQDDIHRMLSYFQAVEQSSQ